jgi:hypothetical protein
LAAKFLAAVVIIPMPSFDLAREVPPSRSGLADGLTWKIGCVAA